MLSRKRSSDRSSSAYALALASASRRAISSCASFLAFSASITPCREHSVRVSARRCVRARECMCVAVLRVSAWYITLAYPWCTLGIYPSRVGVCLSAPEQIPAAFESSLALEAELASVRTTAAAAHRPQSMRPRTSCATLQQTTGTHTRRCMHECKRSKREYACPVQCGVPAVAIGLAGCYWLG